MYRIAWQGNRAQAATDMAYDNDTINTTTVLINMMMKIAVTYKAYSLARQGTAAPVQAFGPVSQVMSCTAEGAAQTKQSSV